MYTAKVIEEIKNKSGWNYLKIGVFKNNEQIGEYIRNYSAFCNTFFPYTQNGKTYALYSPHYTCTRILSLPSCTDIGGEEPANNGFCPVEYYVPEVSITYTKYKDEYFLNYEYDNEEDYTEKIKEIVKQDKKHLNFGFVSGCVWGDDSSWKIEHVNLKNGFERTTLLNYKEQIPSLRLKNSIHFIDFNSRFVKDINEEIKEFHRFKLYIQEDKHYDIEE